MALGGLIGLLCAFIIMQEKLHLMADPNYHPSCSLNPVISCGSVMQSWQSHAFGFPNPFLGLAGFPIMVFAGLALLVGSSFTRRVWQLIQVGVTFGVIFVHWLMFQSIFHINALCPYCMVVWTVTIVMFWYVTLYNLRAHNLPVPERAQPRVEQVSLFLQRHHGDLLIVWFLVILAVIAHHFLYYWQIMLG